MTALSLFAAVVLAVFTSRIVTTDPNAGYCIWSAMNEYHKKIYLLYDLISVESCIINGYIIFHHNNMSNH